LVLIICTAIMFAIAMRVDSGGTYADERITGVIADAVRVGSSGSLHIVDTPQMVELRSSSRGLWFAAVDEQGRSLMSGNVPSHYRSLISRLGDFSYAQIRGRGPPHDLTVVVRREAGPTGPLTIIGHGEVRQVSWTLFLASNAFVVPTCIFLALVSLLVTPWIVRRSLTGVSRIAEEAKQIDVRQRGRRLSEAHAPLEIAPLIQAVNGALRRLDEGFDQQQRFIASAAHELRTPIAILRLKAESAAEAGTKRLLRDIDRIGLLAEQLLDLQRLCNKSDYQWLNLGVLARGVAGDMAPLLIASKRTIDVSLEEPASILGDEGALERVLINLIQNAVEHGGTRISLRICNRTIEVEDDGPGIPVEERSQVFEPFFRLRPRSSGSGLGLSLVQQVVERHAGRVSIVEPQSGTGTLVRIKFATQATS
jgi:signal transduction histidine kinase